MVVVCMWCEDCVDLYKDVIGIDRVFCEAVCATCFHPATCTDAHPGLSIQSWPYTEQLEMQQV